MKSNSYQKFLKQKHAGFNTPDSVISAVVKSATGLIPISKKKVILGEANEVYDVVVEGGRHLIIRISRSSHPGFNAEKWALEETGKAGVPVPKVLLITSKQYNDKDLTFCVEEKLPGSPIRDVPWQEKDKIKTLVVKAGLLLAKIHTVKPTGFGHLAEGGQGGVSSWLEYINEIEEVREDIYNSAIQVGLSSEDLDKGFALLKQNQRLFEPVTPHLLHGDFSPKHILVENDYITGIIDFENCKSGDPMWDFAWWSYFFEKYLPVEWLKEGYCQIGRIDPEFDKKLILYRIRLGLSLVHYYESEGNVSGMQHTKEKLLSDLLTQQIA